MLDQPDRLFEAAKTGDMPALNALLQHGGLELDTRASDGNTALHIAILNGKNKFAQRLIEKGADKEARNNLGNRPLHSAVVADNYEMAVFLLEKEVNYTACNYLKEKLVVTHTEQNQVAPSGQCFEGDWLDRRSNENVKVFTSNATTHLSVQSTAEIVINKLNDKLLKTYAGVLGQSSAMSHYLNCVERYGVSSEETLSALQRARGKMFAVNHVAQIGASEEMLFTNGLTPFELAQRLERREIEAFISDFIFKKDNAPRSERVIERIIERVQVPHVSFFKRVSGVVSAFIPGQQIILPATSLLLMAAAFGDKLEYQEGQKIFSNNSRFLLGAVGLVFIVHYATKGFGRVSERVIANLDASEVALRSLDKTVGELRNQMVGIGNETQETIVLLKDECNRNLVELRGSIKTVSAAIDKGIREERFKPDAKVYMDVHDNQLKVTGINKPSFCSVM